MQSSPQHDQSPPQEQASVEKPRPTILVVEDDPDIRRMLVTSLEMRFDLHTLHAIDGLTAINTVKEHKPALILMDLAMPKMDGLVTTRLLKGNPATQHIPIIAFSNYGRVATWQKMAYDAGCDRCLDKSIRLSELHEVIEELLNPN